MILALLLAVSISSPRIGTFFNLNGMVPDSVPSSRTFGSDDATNSTHRLDPQEQAAVNAVFEACFERMYYGNAGISNVWDESIYGPQCRGGRDLHLFKFSAGTGSFWYEPQYTNRTIRSRRLVEYDNISRLCYALSYYEGSSPDATFRYADRPSWYRYRSYYGQYPHWSSTLFDGLSLEHGRPGGGFPTIDWCKKTDFLCGGTGGKDPYYWPNLTLVWDNVGYSESDPVNWRRSWVSRTQCLFMDSFWFVAFGDPPYGYDAIVSEGYVAPYYYALTNLTMDIIGRGVAGLTNETRRLVSDNLSALGLALSAVDRSYCIVPIYIPTAVSNWVGSASEDYSARFGVGSVTLQWDTVDQKWKCPVSDIDVPELSRNSSTSSVVSVRGGVSHSDDFLVYAHPASLSVGLNSFTTSGGGNTVRWESRSDLVSVFSQHVLALVPNNGSVYVQLGPITLNSAGYVSINCIMMDESAPWSPRYVDIVLGVPPTSFDDVYVTTALHASTSYMFGSTYRKTSLDWPTDSNPYPGDYSRIDTDSPPVLWTLMSRGYNGGTDSSHKFTGTSVSYSPHSQFDQSFEYSSRYGSFNSAVRAFSTADGHYYALAADCMSMFESKTGFDFNDPDDVFSHVSAGLSDSIKNIVFSGEFGMGLEPMCGSSGIKPGGKPLADMTFNVENGVVSVGYMRIIDVDKGDYVTAEPPFGVYSTYLTLSSDNTRFKPGHTPVNNDFHGAGVAGRMSSLSRVDWDWKALKRHKSGD